MFSRTSAIRVARRAARLVGGSGIFFALAALASCSAGEAEPSAIGSAAKAATERAALPGYAASLRARFPGAIGPSIGVSFTSLSSGASRASVSEEARRGVRKPASVTLPAQASGGVTLVDDATGVALRFTLEDATDAPLEVVDGLAIYRNGAAFGGDLVHRVRAEGTEDFVLYESAPSVEAIRYAVTLAGAAGLRNVGGALEVLDASGAPRLRVAPPFVIDAVGARHAATLGVEGCAVDTNASSPLGRAVTPPGSDTCHVRIAWDGAGVRYPALVDPAWATTGTMFAPRTDHTATLLASGDVLMAGGFDVTGTAQASAEIFLAPPVELFALTGSMAAPRGAHSATTITTSPEQVLVAGGAGTTAGPALTSAERYDVTSGTFVATAAPLAAARYHHTATALTPGAASTLVLIAGGSGASGMILNKATLYDPVTDAFTPIANMAVARAGHTATLLSTGDVLIAGGIGTVFALANAELYAPGASTFTALSGAGANMTSARGFATATRFTDAVLGERVLVAGGTNQTVSIATADLYDPVTKTFTQTQPMAAPRANHAAVLLPSGKIMLTGGFDGVSAKADTEVFDPATGAFTFDATMIDTRVDHTATLLLPGQVFVAGGSVGTPASSAELLLRDDGDPCAVDGECGSSHCVEGVCCDDACTGPCISCLAKNQPSGVDGVCGPVKVDEAVGQSCDATSNIEFFLVCDGAGEVTAKGADCKPFACAGLECSTTCTLLTGCDVDGYCDLTDPAAPVCKDHKPNGVSCEADRQCESDLCVDGLCCNDACAGQCEACDTEGAPGVCSLVTGPPHGTRPACAANATECGGVCETNRDACDYPTSACGTLSCADGVATSGACASGDCVPTETSCAPLYCDVAGVMCEAGCSTNAECVQGYQCSVDKKCVVIETTACEDHTLRFPDGTEVDCAPYVCNADQCRTDCSSIADCVAPLVCDPSSRCVTAPPPAEVPPGCSISSENKGRSDFAWAALVALALAYRARASKRSLRT